MIAIEIRYYARSGDIVANAITSCRYRNTSHLFTTSDERVGYSQSCPDQRPHLAEISLIRHQNIVFQGNDDILVRPELEVVRDHTRSVLLFQSLESEWR